MHKSVLLSFQGQNFLLCLLFIRGRQLQKGNVSILFTNSSEQSLLFHLQDLLELFPTLVSEVGQVSVSLRQRLLRGGQTLFGGVQLLSCFLQNVHQLLHLWIVHRIIFALVLQDVSSDFLVHLKAKLDTRTLLILILILPGSKAL